MFNRKAFIGYTLGPDGDQTIFARLASLAFPNVAENQAATDQFGAIVYSAPSPFTEGDTLNKMSDADLAAIIPHGGLALNTSTHFVSYSAPAMIAFRKQAYLEFSLNTTLRASAAGSRYKMAALAFDDHVAHLICPAMAYFKGDLDFGWHRLQHYDSPGGQVRFDTRQRSCRVLSADCRFTML